MNRIRRFAGILAVLLGTLVAFGTVAPAFAMIVPGGSGGSGYAPPPAPAHTVVVVAGMPGWQIALIAIGSALVAATAAVIYDRAHSRRRLATTPA